MDWLYFTHPATGGAFEAQDEDGVRERYEALGWRLTDKPEDVPFVPVKLDKPASEQEWVTLYHPEIRATHVYPNNPEALAGAAEAGWVIPPEPEPEVSDSPADEKSDSKSTKAKAPAKAADSEEK
jgi:hypothetical protein